MNQDIFISVIIPAYNESERIFTTLKDVSEYLNNKEYLYEMIVVDDGSIDDTYEWVRKAEKLFKKFTLIPNGKNMGKGYSVKKGMIAATGEYRLFMDADHSVKIDNLDNFIKEIENGNDIVIGSIEVSDVHKKEDNNQWYRLMLGKMAKILIRVVAVPGIYDTQRGFKLFTRRSVESIFPKQTIDRWGFDIEILAIARCYKMKIKELPVAWINSKSSSLGIMSYFHTFIELCRIKKNLIQGKY